MSNYSGSEWYASDIIAEWTGLADYEREVLSDSPPVDSQGNIQSFEGYTGGAPEWLQDALRGGKIIITLGAVVAAAYVYNSFKR